MEDDEEYWSDSQWMPDKQSAESLTVYEVDEEPIGYLYLPDETVIEVYAERATFGFGRYLDAE